MTAPETKAQSDAAAESATIHAFLNCYLRETGAYDVVSDEAAEAGEAILFELPILGIAIRAPLSYRSPTGRHLFDLPVRFQASEGWLDLDYATLAGLVIKELFLARGGDHVGDELLSRVLSSKNRIERFVSARENDRDRLYGTDFEFLHAEQSLIFGHLLHPTPKSREGIAERNAETYAPELRGSFSLHYFRGDPDIVAQDSASDERADEWVKAELRNDSAIAESFREKHVESDDVLIPVHPWQAKHLLDQPHVESLLADGRLQHLGSRGKPYFPTSSVRTLYSPESSFMVKGSLAVNITNSERTNKRPELERGVAITELLNTELGSELRSRFPDFGVVRDPAYLTVDAGPGSESGFEVVLRENPFRGEDAKGATPVVGLCQDHMFGGDSRLANVVSKIAEREGRPTGEVSEDWFRQYLAISLRPVLWLYLNYGVGLEAHQQNSVLTLRDGYPGRFHYRDNQGYYFTESGHDEVDSLLPGVAERADTLVSDALADERIRYYVVLNNVLGVVNAFGAAGLVDESRLLSVLRTELESLTEHDHEASSLLTSLLTQRQLACKANLLTRFRGMDELTGTLENQSVYTEVPNPITTEVNR
ncbi:IucA/IucC family protein [Haladaptatus pallidirubidus]|uniref:IucA/IucC family siderophore biosynthesis protein n=1 Tax=Haladaptatus pallidirubidus TaxID=1008152 RepID=A0AAV3UL18_9EURY|nr:IucA/IucC family protein [Haladaptatus pallidirubidus]